jgi:hypothetical protein
VARTIALLSSAFVPKLRAFQSTIGANTVAMQIPAHMWVAKDRAAMLPCEKFVNLFQVIYPEGSGIDFVLGSTLSQFDGWPGSGCLLHIINTHADSDIH